MKKIDQNISIIEFILKKKEKRVNDYTKRSTLSENEKIFIGDETQLIKATRELIEAFGVELKRNFGKQPPQAIELEKNVLGVAIMGNAFLDKVKSFLKPEHFYELAHQEIYRAALEIPVLDLSTIVIQLRKNGKLESVGGAYYIAELNAPASQFNIEFHARILIEMAIKRRLIQMCGSIMEDAYSDATDCFDVLERAEKEIAEIKSWIK